MTMITEPRTVFLKDVTLNYAKLVKPVNPFGTEQYELQVSTTDQATVQKMKDLGLNVKERDGNFTVSLKRKATKANGDDNGRPKVFDSQVQEMSDDEVMKLGNGSTGVVKLYQYPYEAAGRKGVATSLTAVQVVNYVEYSGGVSEGFDIYEAPAGSAESSEADIDTMPF